jgi:serine/threonine protein kinase
MKVFLSHQREDKPIVREIGNYLPPDVQAWIDEKDIPAGEEIRQAIVSAITHEVGLLVVFLSEKSILSSWVMGELQLALAREKQIGHNFVIPVLLHDVADRIGPTGVRRAILSRKYIQCLRCDEVCVRAAAGELAQAIRLLSAVDTDDGTPAQPRERGARDTLEINWTELPLAAEHPERLQLLAQHSMLTRDYEKADLFLRVLLDFHGGAKQPDILWQRHLLFFEKACLPERESEKATNIKAAMEFYKYAIDLDSQLAIAPRSEYEVDCPIGFGGLSHVYGVWRENTPYAAKSIRQELLANTSMLDPMVGRLHRIAEMTRRAQSDPSVGIARIEHWDASELHLVIICEYVNGDSLEYHLKTIFKDDDQPSKEVTTKQYRDKCLKLLEQVCGSLAFAHKMGVFHSDVSPSNILIQVRRDSSEPWPRDKLFRNRTPGKWEECSSIKIIDFDTASLSIGPLGSTMTNALVAGTAKFMDPWLVRDPVRHHPNAQSDLYSVGMLAKAMFCGRPDAHEAPSTMCPKATPVLDAVLATATDDKPVRRFECAEDLEKAFKFVRDGGVGTAFRGLSVRTVGIMGVLLALYGASVAFKIPEISDSPGWTRIASLLGLVFAAPILHASIVYGVLMTDSIIREREPRQICYTRALILWWFLCFIGTRLLPGHFFLFLGLICVAGSLRTALYRACEKDMGAADALDIDTKGVAVYAAASGICIGADLVINWDQRASGIVATICYAGVLLFSVMSVWYAKGDRDRRFASLSRSVRWKNVTGNCHGEDSVRSRREGEN